MAIKSEQAVPANEIVVYKPNGRNGNCRGFLGSSKKKGVSMLAKHCSFTGEELVFIINNDIKCRMDDELNAEE